MGIVQGGGVDTDLNDTGRMQAQAFFHAYKDIPFDKVYTSALKRAIQSVESFINLGLPWERHAGLNEMSWGVREGRRLRRRKMHPITTLRRWSEGETGLRLKEAKVPGTV